jgi:hypothetical protein
MITKLSLDIQDTTNTKTFRIVDNSEYNEKINIKDGYLSIIPPGFDRVKSFKVTPGFNEILNTSLLGILPAKTYRQLADLPDGLYQITYSIPPTDRLSVEYFYFRTSKLYQKYYEHICTLYQHRKNYLVKEFSDKKRNLIWIKILIDASKHAAEDNHDNDLAIQLYNEASELLGSNLNC